MLKTILKISFIFLAFFATSCDKTDEEPTDTTFSPEATFTVVNNEETMPVWVHGKEDAEYIILAVHGGPGSDALDFRTYQGGDGFKGLENDYLVAYWQQRASGQSVGSDSDNLFTIQNYVSDTDAVVNQIQTKYPDKKIVLLGHSWGGMLTAAYLENDTRRAKISAWVDAAGAHNGTNLFSATIADINAEADARIQANEEVSYWQGIKDELAADEGAANRLAYEVTEKIPEVVVKVNSSDFTFSSRASSSNAKLFDEIITKNYTSSLANYTLPVLILWGEYDFAVSKTLRQEVIDNVGSENVTSVTFPASGHYMMFHEPALFTSSMKDFIESL